MGLVKKSAKILFFALFIAPIFLFFRLEKSEAFDCSLKTNPPQLIRGDGSGGTFDPFNPNVTFIFPVATCPQAAGKSNYEFRMSCGAFGWPSLEGPPPSLNPATGNLEKVVNWRTPCQLDRDNHEFELWGDGRRLATDRYTVREAPGGVWGTCEITINYPNGPSVNDVVQAYVATDNLKQNIIYSLNLNGTGNPPPIPGNTFRYRDGVKTFNLNNGSPFGVGTYQLKVTGMMGTGAGTISNDVCSYSFGVSTTGGGGGGGPIYEPEKCESNTGIRTAIGCIPTSPAGFSSFFLKYILGLAGVAAFFLIIAAGFIILTSTGNPEKLQGGQQLLTAAVVGSVFIIFSVVILQIIGVDILKGLPGFPEFK